MGEGWYEAVASHTPITQGDIILNCPILAWKDAPVSLHPDAGGSRLETFVESSQADIVVMTQACDLEQGRVANVVICPAIPLSEYRTEWEAAVTGQRQNPTEKAWKKFCNQTKNGLSWNLAILNEGGVGALVTEHRVVDFSEIYTIPRTFLESFLRQQGEQRLRLLPPYREHLSQSFARFFMRVGLPAPVKKVW